MREYSFRGKDFKGQWIKFNLFSLNMMRVGRIELGSIGQYTGLKDKNGVEIYEGDVVASVFTSGEFCNVGDVQFDCGVFGVEWKPCKKNKSMLGSFGQRHNLRRLDDEMIDHIEVIGNIYDNPELLEVDE